jgi:hypothetical protein
VSYDHVRDNVLWPFNPTLREYHNYMRFEFQTLFPLELYTIQYDLTAHELTCLDSNLLNKFFLENGKDYKNLNSDSNLINFSATKINNIFPFLPTTNIFRTTNAFSTHLLAQFQGFSSYSPFYSQWGQEDHVTAVCGEFFGHEYGISFDGDDNDDNDENSLIFENQQQQNQQQQNQQKKDFQNNNPKKEQNNASVDLSPLESTRQIVSSLNITQINLSSTQQGNSHCNNYTNNNTSSSAPYSAVSPHAHPFPPQNTQNYTTYAKNIPTALNITYLPYLRQITSIIASLLSRYWRKQQQQTHRLLPLANLLFLPAGGGPTANEPSQLFTGCVSNFVKFYNLLQILPCDSIPFVYKHPDCLNNPQRTTSAQLPETAPSMGGLQPTKHIGLFLFPPKPYNVFEAFNQDPSGVDNILPKTNGTGINKGTNNGDKNDIQIDKMVLNLNNFNPNLNNLNAPNCVPIIANLATHQSRYHPQPLLQTISPGNTPIPLNPTQNLQFNQILLKKPHFSPSQKHFLFMRQHLYNHTYRKSLEDPGTMDSYKDVVDPYSHMQSLQKQLHVHSLIFSTLFSTGLVWTLFYQTNQTISYIKELYDVNNNPLKPILPESTSPHALVLLLLFNYYALYYNSLHQQLTQGVNLAWNGGEVVDYQMVMPNNHLLLQFVANFIQEGKFGAKNDGNKDDFLGNLNTNKDNYLTYQNEINASAQNGTGDLLSPFLQNNQIFASNFQNNNFNLNNYRNFNNYGPLSTPHNSIGVHGLPPQISMPNNHSNSIHGNKTQNVQNNTKNQQNPQQNTMLQKYVQNKLISGNNPMICSDNGGSNPVLSWPPHYIPEQSNSIDQKNKNNQRSKTTTTRILEPVFTIPQAISRMVEGYIYYTQPLHPNTFAPTLVSSLYKIAQHAVVRLQTRLNEYKKTKEYEIFLFEQNIKNNLTKNNSQQNNPNVNTFNTNFHKTISQTSLMPPHQTTMSPGNAIVFGQCDNDEWTHFTDLVKPLASVQLTAFEYFCIVLCFAPICYVDVFCFDIATNKYIYSPPNQPLYYEDDVDSMVLSTPKKKKRSNQSKSESYKNKSRNNNDQNDEKNEEKCDQNNINHQIYNDQSGDDGDDDDDDDDDDDHDNNDNDDDINDIDDNIQSIMNNRINNPTAVKSGLQFRTPSILSQQLYEQHEKNQLELKRQENEKGKMLFLGSETQNRNFYNDLCVLQEICPAISNNNDITVNYQILHSVCIISDEKRNELIKKWQNFNLTQLILKLFLESNKNQIKLNKFLKKNSNFIDHNLPISFVAQNSTLPRNTPPQQSINPIFPQSIPINRSNPSTANSCLMSENDPKNYPKFSEKSDQNIPPIRKFLNPIPSIAECIDGIDSYIVTPEISSLYTMKHQYIHSSQGMMKKRIKKSVDNNQNDKINDDMNLPYGMRSPNHESVFGIKNNHQQNNTQNNQNNPKTSKLATILSSNDLSELPPIPLHNPPTDDSNNNSINHEITPRTNFSKSDKLSSNSSNKTPHIPSSLHTSHPFSEINHNQSVSDDDDSDGLIIDLEKNFSLGLIMFALECCVKPSYGDLMPLFNGLVYTPAQIMEDPNREQGLVGFGSILGENFDGDGVLSNFSDGKNKDDKNKNVERNINLIKNDANNIVLCYPSNKLKSVLPSHIINLLNDPTINPYTTPIQPKTNRPIIAPKSFLNCLKKYQQNSANFLTNFAQNQDEKSININDINVIPDRNNISIDLNLIMCDHNGVSPTSPQQKQLFHLHTPTNLSSYSSPISANHNLSHKHTGVNAELNSTMFDSIVTGTTPQTALKFFHPGPHTFQNGPNVDKITNDNGGVNENDRDVKVEVVNGGHNNNDKNNQFGTKTNDSKLQSSVRDWFSHGNGHKATNSGADGGDIKIEEKNNNEKKKKQNNSNEYDQNDPKNIENNQQLEALSIPSPRSGRTIHKRSQSQRYSSNLTQDKDKERQSDGLYENEEKNDKNDKNQNIPQNIQKNASQKSANIPTSSLEINIDDRSNPVVPLSTTLARDHQNNGNLGDNVCNSSTQTRQNVNNNFVLHQQQQQQQQQQQKLELEAQFNDNVVKSYHQNSNFSLRNQKNEQKNSEYTSPHTNQSSSPPPPPSLSPSPSPLSTKKSPPYAIYYLIRALLRRAQEPILVALLDHIELDQIVTYRIQWGGLSQGLTVWDIVDIANTFNYAPKFIQRLENITVEAVYGNWSTAVE